MGRQIIGAEDLVIGEEFEDGYDPYEVDAYLGAAPPMRRASTAMTRVVAARPASLAQRAMQVAAAVRRVEGGSLVKSAAPTKSRRYLLGFESLNIAAGGVANITQRPQVLFRPERIVVPSTIAPAFTITDIRIGKNSQLTAVGALACEAFIPQMDGGELKLDTCEVTMDFVLSVQNISLAQQDFRAVVWGEAVE